MTCHSINEECHEEVQNRNSATVTKRLHHVIYLDYESIREVDMMLVISYTTQLTAEPY